MPGGQVRVRAWVSTEQELGNDIGAMCFFWGCYHFLQQVTNPMVVVSNRLPFVLVRKDDGSLERRMR